MQFGSANIEKEILVVLAGESGLQTAILYGSQAAGNAHENSDVDLAVLYDHELGGQEFLSLKLRLENVLKKEVDLVDLYRLHGTILKKILTKGKVLQGKGSARLGQLVVRMIYNQEDMMPYYNRSLEERRNRFVHG